MKGSNWKTTGISILVACVFFYFAVKNTSFVEVFEAIKTVSASHVIIIALGCVLGTVLRGWRWWYTLPEPRHYHEFWPTQRALGICYAANNFIPRSGEVLRVLVLRKATGRSAASLSSTVILDRFFLDLLSLVGLFTIALAINANLILSIYEHAYRLFIILCVLSVSALGGLLLLAFKPAFFVSVLTLIRLDRFPGIFNKFVDLTHELSQGMSVIRTPVRFAIVLLQTLAIWATYFLVFYYALRVFEITTSISYGVLVFSLSMLGIVFPSPGGVGTYHFFTKTALITVFSIGEAQALGFAFFMHAVMFVTNTAYGGVCLLLPNQLSRQLQKKDPA